MPSNEELVQDGARQMMICNACRYCEGYCAVFPAMEQRRVFTKADLMYLANLCFDCRDCYYACQYAPPHEFGVNIPKLMADLRVETYSDFSLPRWLGGLFKRNLMAVAAITVLSVLISFSLVIAFVGSTRLFAAHLDEGAFYRVVPYAAMTLVPLVIAVCGVVVMIAGVVCFWRETANGQCIPVDLGAVRRATRDAFYLTYMKGGGAGCNYPDEAFSDARRWFHHLVFYGFLLDLASTTMAAIYDHFLGWPAPYPVSSWPVMLGSAGGVGLLIGAMGLLYLKWTSDRDPAAERMLKMDVAFLLLLFLTSLTGFLLLFLRDTAAMGSLLVIHLGIVAGLFVTAPYGKFAHVLYRYAALMRYAVEQRHSAQ
jgi:citrate/tricarballylate utilization protein